MVSFVCDNCQTTLKKNKVPTHRCGGRATFSCVDCCLSFTMESHRTHNECISEAEKHQGSMFKGKRFDGGASANSTGGSDGVKPKIKRDKKPAKDKYDDSDSDSSDDDLSSLTAPRGFAPVAAAVTKPAASKPAAVETASKEDKRDKKDKKDKREKRPSPGSDDDGADAAPAAAAVTSESAADALAAEVKKTLTKKGPMTIAKLCRRLERADDVAVVCAALAAIAGDVTVSIAAAE